MPPSAGLSATAPSLPEMNFMPVGSLAVTLTFRAGASPGLRTTTRVSGGRADKLHGGAVDFHLQRAAVDQHAFRQIDVRAAVAVGFHANGDLARLPGGQLDFDRPLVAGGDRAQAVRHRLSYRRRTAA